MAKESGVNISGSVAMQDPPKMVTPRQFPAPLASDVPCMWDVKLDGVRPRLVDDQGRVFHEDSLVVEARSKEEAIGRYMRFCGIIGTEKAFDTRTVTLPFTKTNTVTGTGRECSKPDYALDQKLAGE